VFGYFVPVCVLPKNTKGRSSRPYRFSDCSYYTTTGGD
jgi:hypothetical protein